ncbi:MAG: glycosyl transferase [Pseudonocardia sp.]|nr:glycosyl transferase [Pseudonocardia sp.]
MSGNAAPRLRIVHVSDCYAPRLGGIEVQVAELAHRQAEAGHETHVITATRAHDAEAGPPPAAGPRVHRVVAAMPFELPVHPRPAKHLNRLFDELKPDAVHVHIGAVSPFAWSAARCAQRRGLPLVATVHSIWDPVTSGIYRLLDGGWRWSRWPLVLTPVSEPAARPIRHVTRGRTRINVVPNGLDLQAWRPLPRPAAGTPAGTPGGTPAGTSAGPARRVRVVAVGRLAPRKQPLTLLRVLRAAAQQVGPEVGLQATIIGDGPAEASMRRYLQRHDMTGWVRLAGRVDRDQLPQVLAGADVFVAPAVREAFGLAALEARTAGLPIIARSGTGIADFVTDGREGLLADDEQELTDAVARLAIDHELRDQIAAINRASAPARSAWPAVLAALERCYALARPDAGAAMPPKLPSSPIEPSRP